VRGSGLRNFRLAEEH